MGGGRGIGSGLLDPKADFEKQRILFCTAYPVTGSLATSKLYWKILKHVIRRKIIFDYGIAFVLFSLSQVVLYGVGIFH